MKYRRTQAPAMPVLDNPAHLSDAAMEKLYALFMRLDAVIKEKYQPMLQRGDVRGYRESGAEDVTAMRAQVGRLLWSPEKPVFSETLSIMEVMHVIRTLLQEDAPEIDTIRKELEHRQSTLEEEAHACRLALPMTPTGVGAGYSLRHAH